MAVLGAVYDEWNMFMTDERPTGVPEADLTPHLRLAGPELDRKLSALRAMATQTAELVAALDPDAYRLGIADETFLDATDADRSQTLAHSAGSVR